MTDTSRIDSPWKWVEGHHARRPLLPSEKRVTTERVRRLLPATRADLGSPRPLLPWANRAGNDWRGCTPG